MAKKTKKVSSKSLEKQVGELLTEFLKLAGVSAEFKIEANKIDDGHAVEINLETSDDAGLLIGRRGETLNAIQSFLTMALKQQTGEWVRVMVNIGDWRDKEEERLAALSRQAAERAKTTGEPQTLYNLSPAQRRTVHLALEGDSEIVTESFGEGSERYLIVKSK